MTRIASAADIKASVRGKRVPGAPKPTDGKPRPGSALRRLYDALHLAAAEKAFVPHASLDKEGRQRTMYMIGRLHIEYGCDIVAVYMPNPLAPGKGRRSHVIAGYRLIGEWHGSRYVTYSD